MHEDLLQQADEKIHGAGVATLALNIERIKGESTGAEAFASQTKDILEWIMKWEAVEWTSDTKMLAKLERLEASMEKALLTYEKEYGEKFEHITGMVESIDLGYPGEWLTPDNADIKGIFYGLDEALLAEDTTLFRNFFMKFMEKSPEVQASMLRFFELVRAYVLPASRGRAQISLHMNPLKKILFGENDISYKEWIVGIFEGFEKNEAEMISLSKSIKDAEAPQIWLNQFIESLLTENPSIIEQEDCDWLEWFQERYGNGEKKSREDIAKHTSIATKYIMLYGENGTASEVAKKVAQDLKDGVSHK